MKVLPIAYQKQWGVNYSINDKRRDFMSDNNKKVEEKAAEIIQATETQTVKPAAAENKEFKKKKSTTWERNQRKWGWAFILPTMIGIIVLNLWPIVQTIYQSFCKVGSFGDSSFAGFANYKKMFADPEVWQSLLNTFKYAIIEVPFSIAIALILAVFLCLSAVGCDKGKEADNTASDNGGELDMADLDDIDISLDGTVSDDGTSGGSGGSKNPVKEINAKDRLSVFGNIPKKLRGTSVTFAHWGDEGGEEYVKVAKELTLSGSFTTNVNTPQTLQLRLLPIRDLTL
jgi:hypothetical protein